MEKEFKDLIDEMKEFFGVGSLEKVAESLGFNRSVATTWRGRKSFSKNAILKYNLIKSQAGQNPSFQKTKKLNAINTSPDFIQIPVYDVIASAGNGLVNDEQILENVGVDKSFLKGYFGLTSFIDLSIITAKGDSMTPTIPENSQLLIQRLLPQEGQICVVRIDDELFVKRLQKLPKYKLLSDNKRYEDIDLEGRDYEIVGVVVGLFKRVA